MAAGNTYTILATTSGSGTSSITFSSISGSYTDLVLVVGGTVSSGVSCYIEINSDTGANYGYLNLNGSASGAASAMGTSQTSMYYGPMHDQGNTIIMNFNSYANTTIYKTVTFRQNSNLTTSITAGRWNSAAAITSIKVVTGGAQTFPSTTKFTLYGIAAA